MAKCVVRLDQIEGAIPVSFKYYSSGTTEAAIENGMFVALNGLVSGEREVFKAVPIADASAAGASIDSGNIVLVASPEYMSEVTKVNLDDFENPAGAICRGYILRKGNIYSCTAEAFGTVPTSTLKYVTLKADGETQVDGVSTVVENKIGDYLGSETVGSKTFYVIRVAD